MIEMKPVEGNKVKLQFLVPSRGLIGYRAEFQIDTHGSGVLNRIFHSYIPFKGQLDKVYFHLFFFIFSFSSIFSNK